MHVCTYGTLAGGIRTTSNGAALSTEVGMTIRFTEPLDMEFMEEAAASLGAAGRKLARSLEALETYEAQAAGGIDATVRAELVSAAGEALWGLVVQRELLGFRDQGFITAHYEVPREVWRTMGPKR